MYRYSANVHVKKTRGEHGAIIVKAGTYLAAAGEIH